MRRLLRNAFTICSAISLVLCVAVCVLWVRSYWVTDSRLLQVNGVPCEARSSRGWMTLGTDYLPYTIAVRRWQEEVERERKEREQARKEAEEKKAEERRQAELRQRQAQQLDAMRAQAEKETRLRAQAERESQLRAQAERESQLRAQAERESQLRAQADQEARARAAQAAAGAARNKAQLDWIDKIRSRIRGYINLPPDIPGNPEAVFDVVQLPTGEIIDVKLRKSSGVRAYDDAVQRAILKASPLPRAVPADLFQRNLELRFRPLDQ
jgi:colicin import membrane protein